MSWNGRSVLAVVPARGGSKGIPHKNLQLVGGLSLVARAARVACALPWVDHAVLSTDAAAIADEGRRHGLEVPFLRPATLAGDRAAAAPAWQHAWLASEAHFGCRFDLSVWLQPTSPFRTAEDVERTVRALVDGGHQAATTVSRVPGHFTPHKILTMDAAGRIAHYLPEGAGVVARQEIPPYWYRNGLCYAVTRETLVERGHIIEEDCVGVEIDGPVVNIDEPFELEIARFLADREGIP
jgi:CMP-N-acetylneuraminic acid synthetase